MKKKLLITIVACGCLIMPLAYGQQDAGQANNNSELLKQKAVQLLNKLEGATPVEPEENLIGMTVDSVKKSGDDYEIYMRCTNKILKDIYPAVYRTIFIDPENYKNRTLTYTIGDDGALSMTFSTTPGGYYAIIPTKLKPASQVMYVYYIGVKAPDPKELYTVPLFFTIVLGDEPYILENTPRHAGTLFDEVQE